MKELIKFGYLAITYRANSTNTKNRVSLRLNATTTHLFRETIETNTKDFIYHKLFIKC